jgi:hypothetical protein
MTELEMLRAQLKAANERVVELEKQLTYWVENPSIKTTHLSEGAAAERARIVAAGRRWCAELTHDGEGDWAMAVATFVNFIEFDNAEFPAERAHLPSATEGER